MTSQSPRIYIYKITFEEVPYYYYGVHKEQKYNEKYFGRPVTHKWCWELYTPKKQILQLFDFTNEGWLEALEVERRIIKQFYKTDKWCLNENCGGLISLDISRKCAKMGGEKSYELGVGVHSLTKDENVMYGKMGAEKCKKLGIGIVALTKDELIENGKKGGKKAKEMKLGIHGFTKEKRVEIVSKTNSQRWMCLETGYITSPGALTRYQRNRNIDVSKRTQIL